MRSSLSMSRIARPIRCNRGTTTPECAILALVVIAAVIFALGSLGQLAARTFSGVGLEPDGAVASANTAAPGATEAFLWAAIPDDLSSWTQWANVLFLVVAAVAMVWLFLRKKSLKSPRTPRPLAKDLHDTSCLTLVEKRQRIAKRLYNDTNTLLKGDLEVRHLMTNSPVTVGPKVTVQRAQK